MTASTRISLLERVSQRPDGATWNEFVEVYDHLILSWLARQGVPPEDAEDIRQEVMVTVSQEIGNFEHNGRAGAFRKWLRTITSHRLHRHWRNRAGQASAGAVDLGDLADQLADDSNRLSLIWDARHDHFVLEKLMGMLGTRFSESSTLAFWRIAVAQEPADKVAAELGMSLGSARVAQHRVLRALKELGKGLID